MELLNFLSQVPIPVLILVIAVLVVVTAVVVYQYAKAKGLDGMSCILGLLLMMNAETTSTLSSLPEMITRMSADLIMSEKYGSSSMGGKKS